MADGESFRFRDRGGIRRRSRFRRVPRALLENRVDQHPAQELLRTPLDALHRDLGAKMVPFAGYAMPLQYEGIIAEHRHTRAAAGLFDVSHMGQARLRAAGAAEMLETMVPGDIVGLAAGRMRYTVLTNARGGILDDLMVTATADHLLLVVNAACKERDFAHIEKKTKAPCTLEVLNDRALLALQGPRAADVLARFAPACRQMPFMSAESLSLAGVGCFVTRSGYTGEDGFEISAPPMRRFGWPKRLWASPKSAPPGWARATRSASKPAFAFTAMTSTRRRHPVEAGLSWIVGRRRRAEGGFPGADVILGQIADGVARKRVGIRPDGKAPVRTHARIMDSSGEAIGEITSGGFGPSVEAPVAMGYVASAHAAPGTPVTVEARGKALPATVAKLPFVELRYFKTQR